MLDDAIQALRSMFSTFPVDERRQFLRRPCRYAVYCLERKKTFEGVVWDISPRGMRLLTPKKVTAGQSVYLVYRGVPGGQLTRLPRNKLDEVSNKLPCQVVYSGRKDDAYEACLRFEPGESWVKVLLDKTIAEHGSFEERRRSIRAKACFNADLRHAGGTVTGVLTNISMGGALFQSSKHLEVSKGITLATRAHPKLPSLAVGGDLIHHQFDVVSNSGLHCIRFGALDPQVKKTLEQYVTHLLKTQGSH